MYGMALNFVDTLWLLTFPSTLAYRSTVTCWSFHLSDGSFMDCTIEAASNLFAAYFLPRRKVFF